MLLYSIIVPIYNVEKYIHKCLESLLGQTFGDIEIILVDDESPDNCPAICDEYAKKDNRIKVVHQKNGGLSDARNTGLSIAKGKYIIFVDSDDYIDKHTCEQFAKYTENDIDIIIGEAVVESGTCYVRHIEPSEEVFDGLSYLKTALMQEKATMAAWLNVYKKDFLVKNKLFFKKGILHEDEQFTPRAFMLAQTVIVTGLEFYHYVIRENSITTKKDKRKNALDLYNTCCELEKKYLSVEDKYLKDLLLNSLSVKCLNMFQQGKLYQYGKEYIYKDFIKRNAKLPKTVYKAKLYCFSPRLYYFVNGFLKMFTS